MFQPLAVILGKSSLPCLGYLLPQASTGTNTSCVFLKSFAMMLKTENERKRVSYSCSRGRIVLSEILHRDTVIHHFEVCSRCDWWYLQRWSLLALQATAGMARMLEHRRACRCYSTNLTNLAGRHYENLPLNPARTTNIRKLTTKSSSLVYSAVAVLVRMRRAERATPFLSFRPRTL
jgi:hypothetical protein